MRKNTCRRKIAKLRNGGHLVLGGQCGERVALSSLSQPHITIGRPAIMAPSASLIGRGVHRAMAAAATTA
jgi:hypothetical protein